jgi:hypothetical protein
MGVDLVGPADESRAPSSMYLLFPVYTSVFRLTVYSAYLLVLAEILFVPEDGGDMFLRNVCCISTDHKASHPRR